MEHIASHETVAVLYELDIGQHTLFLMSDGSLDLLTHDQHSSTRVGYGVHLDRDEAYRLCISLSMQFPTPPMKGKGETSDQGLPGQQQHKRKLVPVFETETSGETFPNPCKKFV